MKTLGYTPGLAIDEICELYPAAADGRPLRRIRRPGPPSAGKAPSATFVVTYSGFTAEAEAAFQRAVDLLAPLISSPQTINVSASFAPLGSGVLGSAGPNGAFFLTGGSIPAGERRVVGRPLTEALINSDTNPGGADINATFNSTFTDWHFGEEDPPSNKWDFTSVVMHELLHGLNVTRWANVDDGAGSAECAGTNGEGCLDVFGNPASADYGINDVLFQNGSAVLLRTYADPSAALGTALLGGDGGVFFGGSIATSLNGGAPPRLHSPATWAPGSSVSHLDDVFDGTANALMTHSIANGEIIRTPGSVTCGLLADLGWTVDLAACAEQPLPVELVAFEAVADGSSVRLTWETASETNNAGFEVQHAAPEAPAAETWTWQTLAFVAGAGTTLEAQRYAFEAGDLGPGRHVFRLKQLDYDGSFEYHAEVEIVVEQRATYMLSDAYPNPFNPQAQFVLSLAHQQRVTVEVFDVHGRRVALLHDGLLAPHRRHRFTIDGRSLPSGLYLYRATGPRFSATRTVVLVR